MASYIVPWGYYRCNLYAKPTLTRCIIKSNYVSQQILINMPVLQQVKNETHSKTF